MGPNFVPWGTPALTCAHSEFYFPSFTLCLRVNKKSHNHGIRDLRSPKLISFVISAFKLILSNALLKSSKTIRSEHPSASSLDNQK